MKNLTRKRAVNNIYWWVVKWFTGRDLRLTKPWCQVQCMLSCSGCETLVLSVIRSTSLCSTTALKWFCPPYQWSRDNPREWSFSDSRDLELNRSASAVSMMGCDNSDYSYCVTNYPGPGVTEVLEEPVEEESEGEVSDVMELGTRE